MAEHALGGSQLGGRSPSSRRENAAHLNDGLAFASMATSVPSRVRSRLARSAALRSARARVRYTSSALRWIAKNGSFADLPAESAVRMAFNVMLRRDPETEGYRHFVPRLNAGALTRDEMVEENRGSEEFIYHVGFRT